MGPVHDGRHQVHLSEPREAPEWSPVTAWEEETVLSGHGLKLAGKSEFRTLQWGEHMEVQPALQKEREEWVARACAQGAGGSSGQS